MPPAAAAATGQLICTLWFLSHTQFAGKYFQRVLKLAHMSSLYIHLLNLLISIYWSTCIACPPSTSQATYNLIHTFESFTLPHLNWYPSVQLDPGEFCFWILPIHKQKFVCVLFDTFLGESSLQGCSCDNLFYTVDLVLFDIGSDLSEVL